MASLFHRIGEGLASFRHEAPGVWTWAREIRINTGYKRAKREAHNLVRKILTQPGDIDPTVPGFLSITLDPMPTKRETLAVAELCESLTETRTQYPGTELVLRYAIKERL